MKKIFSLFLAVACCSMAFGQIISVTDGTLADWDNVPSDYLFKTECAPNASWNGLKSVQVYVDLTNINLLVEVNDDVVTDRNWTPFHVFINSDNNAATGGYGDQWTDADTDLVFETAIFASGAVYPYNPAVYKWWGPVGGSGWLWIDPSIYPDETNGWGALVPKGSLPIGNSQIVDGKIEIQLDYTLIPMPFDKTTFTLGFDIQQNWSSVGVLPNAHENGRDVLAEKLRVYVHQQNKSGYVTINDIQYKITSNIEPYTAEVFSLFNKDVDITEIVIPETIVVDGITYTVTSIGEYAFSDCFSLSSITIPNSVTSIGKRAFNECRSLVSIAIPNSVTSIGDYAFFGCSSLISVAIGNSVTSIGDYAFSICFSLASLTIPNSVTSIGESAFSNCYSLSSITIPNSVTSIGKRAFDTCESLTSVIIGNGVKNIGYGAFEGCSSLASITIPESVTSIGGGAFMYCSSLTSIVVDNGNVAYDSRNNCNAIIETATNTLIAGCKKTIIPNSVTSIGYVAFVGCIDLTTVIIPESVTSIGDYAFSECYSLTDITIPNSVTSIGESAFEICYSLTTVICHAVVVPSLDRWGFDEVPTSSAVLYVPAESMDDYKAADQWKDFGTILPLEEAPSAVDNVEASTRGTQKLLRNGQLVIIRDGKTYNAMGQEW